MVVTVVVGEFGAVEVVLDDGKVPTWRWKDPAGSSGSCR
jgi:hypothetical protein